MRQIPIPKWNARGALPPIDLTNPISLYRSPYPVSMLELVVRLGTTHARRTILQGFLAYRAELHKAGLNTGFQWLDGSFTENLETTEQRAPNDIDVVSFLEGSARLSDAAIAANDIFDRGRAKAHYLVDGYFVELDELPPSEIVSWSAYWYSMWSHRRNQDWKGFLQVDLSPADDSRALRRLTGPGSARERI
jgi:hypothetical protein